ncbi:MAG: hypothetical protein OIF35_06320 [Cellvibrionaceae bacterium]|nr:hypothetical protein [Cellvibrionaceae bacterium]
MPAYLNGSETYEFNYGPNRARYRQRHISGALERVTHYVSGNFEVIYQGAKTEYRHLLRTNGQVIMMRRETSMGGNSNIDHQYIHRDHLGSITAVSKESDGSLLGAMSYDAGANAVVPPTGMAATKLQLLYRALSVAIPVMSIWWVWILFI